MAKKQQTFQSVPLVAIDLGSHSVRAMAAELTENNMLRILGVESSSKFPCVERGIVCNTSNSGYTISEILKFLSNRIHVDSLPSAFVCVGGRTMQVVPVCSKRDQVRKREITQMMLDDMEMECKQKIEAHNSDVAVLDLVPYYYKLDGVEQDEQPNIDQRAAQVEAHFMAFVGKKDLEQKVIDSFNRSGKRMEHSYVRPDALLNVLTTESDAEKGCAILDLGAQTTTLTVYKGNQYLYNKVVPQGGYDITRDIEQMGISLAYAESLKCKYGFVSPNLVPKDQRFRIPAVEPTRGEIVVTSSELAAIISNRLAQIVNPLVEKLNSEDERFGVLYITGGGAMLQGILQYIQSKTNIPVMYGSHTAWLTPDTPDEMCLPTYSALVGTLLLGASYRKAHPVPAPSDNRKKIIDFLTEKTLEIFTDQY